MTPLLPDYVKRSLHHPTGSDVGVIGTLPLPARSSRETKPLRAGIGESFSGMGRLKRVKRRARCWHAHLAFLSAPLGQV
jgi:hypothetical protein